MLAVTALVLQLARGESTAVDPGALLLPFVLLTLPVLALTAAAAVLFETVPVLRGGLGNIAWFFVWMITAIAGARRAAGRARHRSAASMRQAMAAQQLPAAAEFSVGFTKVDQPLRTFAWAGLHPSGGFVAARLALILAAACLAVLPAAWFGRFDPARGRPRGVRPLRGAAQPGTRRRARRGPGGRGSPRHAGLPAAAARPGPARLAFGRLLAGEVRILVQGISRWWWLVAAALTRRQPRRPRQPGEARRRQHRAAAVGGLDLAGADLVPAGHPAPRERAGHPARRLPGRLPAAGRRMGRPGWRSPPSPGSGPCCGWPSRPTARAWPRGWPAPCSSPRSH